MILKELKIEVWKGHVTNCYIINDEETKETMVIDPAGNIDKVVEMIEILKGNLKYIYLTHCHCDHIIGVKELKERCGGTILIHRADAEGLKNSEINLSAQKIDREIVLEPDARVDDKDLIHLGGLELKVIHTPGHTIGGSCLYCEEENLLISGDTLFKGTWGRTDVPTSSIEDIMDSITNKLLTLPADTLVYPGHGKATKIKDEMPIYLELKPNLM